MILIEYIPGYISDKVDMYSPMISLVILFASPRLYGTTDYRAFMLVHPLLCNLQWLDSKITLYNMRFNEIFIFPELHSLVPISAHPDDVHEQHRHMSMNPIHSHFLVPISTHLND